jgi:hypothetical protein
MMQDGGLDCVTGLGKYQERLIILLDIARVLAVRDPRNEAAAEDAANKLFSASVNPGAQATARTEPGTEKAMGTKSTSAGK